MCCGTSVNDETDGKSNGVDKADFLDPDGNSVNISNRLVLFRSFAELSVEIDNGNFANRWKRLVLFEFFAELSAGNDDANSVESSNRVARVGSLVKFSVGIEYDLIHKYWSKLLYVLFSNCSVDMFFVFPTLH